MEENTPVKKSNLLSIVLSVLVVLLIISNGVTIYYLFLKNNSAVNINTALINSNTNNNNETANYNVNENINNNINANANIDQNTNSKPPPVEPPKEDLTSGQILVDWYSWPVIPKWYDVFPSTYKDGALDYDSLANKLKLDTKNGSFAALQNYFGNYNFYQVGTIKEGNYKSDNIFLIFEQPEMGGQPLYYVIKDNNDLILLKKLSDEDPYGNEINLFKVNNQITIKNLEPQETINIPTNANLRLIKINRGGFGYINTLMDVKNPTPLFKYNGTDYVYMGSNGCFFTKANDWTIRDYYLDLPFLKTKTEPIKYFSEQFPALLNITWNNNEKNKNEYTMYLGGCGGIGNCYNYADYIKDKSQLIETGKTSSGDPVYELKDVKLKTSKDEKNLLQSIYDTHYSGSNEKKISYQDFLNDHPLIFWEDPFGKFIEFRNANYLPMAECGKPVIYLYPEKEEEVNVSVQPNGGFSYTDPEYGNGWKVIAKPTGELTNPENFSTYPYLFWEGKALNYQRPDKGFVVRKGEIRPFLEKTLAKLGLIKNEYDEFIKFWLPKMQEHNYYFITFVPQEEFNNYAPLSINPTPDTVIRVFMDYQGLDKPINVIEPEIITPQRKGFTVVEWGGALHK